MSTSVYYFVPEDGDDEAHPNFFSLGRPAAKLRLGDVKAGFPLPGAYHFRFKKAFKNTYVWLDALDDAEVVPRYDGQVVAKISRISVHAAGPAVRGAPGSAAAAGRPSSRLSSSSSKASASTGARRARAPSGGASSGVDTPPLRAGTSSPGRMPEKHNSGDLLGLHSSGGHGASISAPVPMRGPAGATSSPSASPALVGESSSSLSSRSAAAGTGPRSGGGASASGLRKPPTVAPHSSSSSSSSPSTSSAADALHSMDLDWSSAAPSPAPSPPMMPSVAKPMAMNGGRSSSPVRRPGSRNGAPKTSLSIPNDLSSAAKDFKL